MQMIRWIFILALFLSACGNNNPNPLINLSNQVILSKENSEDHKVTAYIIKNFEGGATGNTYYDVVVGESGKSNGRLQARSSAYTKVPVIRWQGNALMIYYTDQVIWNFSNVVILDNQVETARYEVFLIKKKM
jgi:hypothetical protein